VPSARKNAITVDRIARSLVTAVTVWESVRLAPARRRAGDRALRCRLGEAGRALIARSFSDEREVGGYLEVYRRAVASLTKA